MNPNHLCDLCGCRIEGHAHFALGRVWCSECFVEEPPMAMPPLPREAEQIAEWLKPLSPLPRLACGTREC
jgi:hypothetical protein